MKSKTATILTVMHVICWIVFIGLCIKTGVLVFSFFMSLFVDSGFSKNLYIDQDLYAVYAVNKQYFYSILSFIIAISALKTYIFYLVIQLFLKIDFTHPFSEKLSTITSKISYAALETGILALIASGYTANLEKRGVNIPAFDWGASEFLFLAAVIFILATLFKKAVELQSENELTV